MPVTYRVEDSAPILSVHGRLDAAAAAEFDKVWTSIPDAVTHAVIDLSEVAYISSIGIRSLISAEKNLRQRHGRAVLTGLSRFVASVLENTRLLHEFQTAATCAEGCELVRNSTLPSRTSFERTISGRSYVLSVTGGDSCSVDVWGEYERMPEDSESLIPFLSRPHASRPFNATVEELGVAFGNGALGNGGQWTPAICGPLFSGETFAAVLPANGNGQADFSISSQPSDIDLTVSIAISFSGPPFAKIDLALSEPVELRVIIADIAELVRERDGTSANLLGFLIQETEGPGSLLMGVAGDDHLFGTCVRFRSIPTLKPQLSDLEGVEALTPKTTVRSSTIRMYLPARVRHGAERLLKIEVEGGRAIPEEWSQILRRLYHDCSRIVLSQLTGGYMATTFRVVSYDREGRRLLPTVTKISTNELIHREESAHRAYVQKFILNNSTTIMGSATVGSWSALRYNFLGVSGPNATLTWLQDHYYVRPIEEIQKLYARLYTQILKPWYGQPRWEALSLYKDHTPLRLFPRLFEHAERDFGFSPTADRIECEELGVTFANPFRFLRTEYPKRSNQSQLWYQSVTHGDLNPRNILVDELDNLYIIDFSETGLRNIVSDFARMETVLKFETTRVESSADVARLVEFELGLAEMNSLSDIPPNRYRGDDPRVEKAYRAICQLRRYADIATLFETDPAPYWLALLEWTFSVLSYDLIPLRRKLAAYSAAILCEKLASHRF